MDTRGLYALFAVFACTCLCLLVSPAFTWASDPEESDTVLNENLLPAQQGDPQAQVFVAYLYETGQGVKRDYSLAAQWYGKAAEQGNPVAQFQLGNMYHLGRGVTQNYIKAYMWLELSAESGNPNAREIRRVVAGKMDPSDIAEAKRMAEEWKPVKN